LILIVLVVGVVIFLVSQKSNPSQSPEYYDY
jgi:hypothetical protein